MLVWCNLAAASASRWKRCTAFGVKPSPAESTFRATLRLSDTCWASKTIPMPPRPISRTISKSPRRLPTSSCMANASSAAMDLPGFTRLSRTSRHGKSLLALGAGLRPRRPLSHPCRTVQLRARSLCDDRLYPSATLLAWIVNDRAAEFRQAASLGVPVDKIEQPSLAGVGIQLLAGTHLDPELEPFPRAFHGIRRDVPEPGVSGRIAGEEASAIAAEGHRFDGAGMFQRWVVPNRS